MIHLALRIFCSRLVINGHRSLNPKGPVLITANHPNSFLDAIIIGSLFNRPVHYLARGDAFTKPWHGRLLGFLHMIPIFRLSEGKEYLVLNENAFKKSKEILSKGGIVLIFIEGICVHKHELQPFKKGAARIALENRENKEFSVLPIALAYDSFEQFGKTVSIQIGTPLLPPQLFPFNEEARNMRHFNFILYEVLNSMIVVPADKEKFLKPCRLILFIPAVAGSILHLFLYGLTRNFVKKKTKGTVFYDSVLFGSLLFLYPVYVIFICIILLWLLGSVYIAVSAFLIFPFLAWCTVQWRRSF